MPNSWAFAVLSVHAWVIARHARWNHGNSYPCSPDSDSPSKISNKFSMIPRQSLVSLPSARKGLLTVYPGKSYVIGRITGSEGSSLSRRLRIRSTTNGEMSKLGRSLKRGVDRLRRLLRSIFRGV